jgi:hypothetical protein
MADSTVDTRREPATAADTSAETGRFDVAAIAADFPATATTLLIDVYLTNRPRRARGCSASTSRRHRAITRAATNISMWSRGAARFG